MSNPPVGFYVRECVKWLSVCVAVVYAIRATQSSVPILFFFISGIYSASWADDNKDESPDPPKETE